MPQKWETIPSFPHTPVYTPGAERRRCSDPKGSHPIGNTTPHLASCATFPCPAVLLAPLGPQHPELQHLQRAVLEPEDHEAQDLLGLAQGPRKDLGLGSSFPFASPFWWFVVLINFQIGWVSSMKAIEKEATRSAVSLCLDRRARMLNLGGQVITMIPKVRSGKPGGGRHVSKGWTCLLSLLSMLNTQTVGETTEFLMMSPFS